MRKASRRPSPQARDEEAIRHLRQSLEQGDHWYPVLLEAMSLWGSSEEVYQERRYGYLVGGEAFDLLLLAERLYQEVRPSVPADEVERLLFRAEPPLELTREEFRRRLGAAKHRAHLNFFYGVIVEEALLLAVQSEVRKEQFSGGFFSEDEVIEQAYRRVYSESLEQLLKQFRKERKQRSKNPIALEEQQEFTYWLFKGRLKRAESARMASDTRKALSWLHRSWADRKSVFR
jgi:hypothetical protein